MQYYALSNLSFHFDLRENNCKFFPFLILDFSIAMSFVGRLSYNLPRNISVNFLYLAPIVCLNKHGFSSFTSLRQVASQSTTSRKPLYEKHIPISPVQRGLLALGSAVITFSDLYRDGVLLTMLKNFNFNANIS